MYKLLRSSAGTLARYVGRRLKGARRRRRGTDRSVEIAIVIMVSDELHNRMRRLQLELQDRYGESSGLRVSPHISLKQGFRASSVERFERYFDELVTDIEPFEVRTRGVAAFDEEILFVDVEPSAPLEALRRRIVGDLAEQHGVGPGRFEGDEFHFHATLAYGLSREVLGSAREAFGSASFDCSFRLDTLGMLVQAGDGWTTYKRTRLSKARRGPPPGAPSRTERGTS